MNGNLPATVHFIWFLTRPRTDDEIQTMLVSAHAIACACVHAPDALSPPFRRYIHDFGLRTLMRPSDKSPFDNLVGFMTQGFLSLRNMGYKGFPRLFISLAPRKRRDWPDCVTPSQLLPFGREQTVRDLATWFGARSTSLQLQTTLLTLLEILVKNRTGETIPFFVTSPLLVNGILSMITKGNSLSSACASASVLLEG
jgi:hypothetical protein